MECLSTSISCLPGTGPYWKLDSAIIQRSCSLFSFFRSDLEIEFMIMIVTRFQCTCCCIDFLWINYNIDLNRILATGSWPCYFWYHSSNLKLPHKWIFWIIKTRPTKQNFMELLDRYTVLNVNSCGPQFLPVWNALDIYKYIYIFLIVYLHVCMCVNYTLIFTCMSTYVYIFIYLRTYV